MRTKNTIKNSVVTLAFQIVTLIIGFVVPRWVISVYGSDVNGLTTNINQVINIINLLQAGLVGASIFEMYKPISKGDYETVGNIYYSSQKYFSRMSILFFVLTLFMIPYLLLDKNTNLRSSDIVMSVLILGINATFVFRYNCKYDAIFSAHQKKYLLIFSSIIEKIIYYCLLFGILYFRKHYLWMYLALFIASLGKIAYLKKEFNKLYYDKIKEFKSLTNYKVKNQYHLFGNQIIQNIIESVPVIFVTLFNGLAYASVLSIYLLITNFLRMIFTTLQNAVAASFGDYIASKVQNKAVEIFELVQIIFSGLLIVIINCLSVLYLPFIKLYSEGAAKFSYIFPALGAVMIFYITCNISFLCFNLMINSFGLYGKVLKMNIVFGGISAFIMIIFAGIDFQLVYIGTGVFYLCAIIHRYIVLKKEGIPIGKRHLENSLFPIFIMILEIPLLKINMGIEDIRTWVVSGIIVFSGSVILVTILGVLFRRQNLRLLLQYWKTFRRR